MEADQPRERKGTLVCDHNSRLDINEYSLSPSHAEVEGKSFSRGH